MNSPLYVCSHDVDAHNVVLLVIISIGYMGNSLCTTEALVIVV